MIFFSYLFFQFSPSLQANSQQPLVLTETINHYRLGHHISYLEDPSQVLSIHDVRKKIFAEKFTPSIEEIPYFGLSESSYWVRFSVIDKSPVKKKWLLEIAYQFYYYIDIYIVRANDVIEHKKSGDYLATTNREIQHRNYIFKLSLEKNHITHIFIKIRSKLMVFPLSIWCQSEFTDSVQKEHILLGIYYGIIAVMIIYNFFIFLSIKDRSYLFYVLYAISYMSWQFSYNGLGHRFLWPNHPELRILNTLLSPFVLFFILLFTNHFLLKIKHNTLFNKIHTILISLSVFELFIIILTRIIFKSLGIGVSPLLSIVITDFANILNAGVIIYVMIGGIFSFYKGFKPAKFFLLAWILFSLGMITFNLMMLNILPFNFITNNSIQIGSAFEIILFSFALADRINILKTEKEIAQEKYETLIETIPYGILDINKEGNINFCNSAYANMLGYKTSEIINQPVWHMFDDVNSIDRLKAHLEQLMAEKATPFSFSTQCVTAHKTLIDILVDWIYKRDEKNKINGLIAVITDITERKKTEEEKLKLQAHLKHVKRMESLGTMAGGIAHDFNNLLMSIIGNTSLVLMDIDANHPHYEKFRSIEKAIESGSNLTRQFLVFAKGGNNEKIPGNINSTIRKTSSIMSRTHKNVKFHEDLRDDIYIIEFDQGQVEQVLLNLYLNACQAMPNGGDITIRTENVFLADNFVKPFAVDSGQYVKISVEDNGIGIDKNIIEKIFDPFFTTKEMGRGTGLGLASAYGIIKNHNGIMSVTSEKGKGATFLIYLPKAPNNSAKPQEKKTGLLPGKEIILLVDDEPMIINIGKKFLEKMGYTALCAVNGSEAIEQYTINKDSIQLVILDMVMPDFGGAIAFAKLQKINPDIKVLLSSGNNRDLEIEDLLQKGAHGFIQKPFDIETLSNSIREIFDNHYAK